MEEQKLKKVIKALTKKELNESLKEFEIIIVALGKEIKRRK